jgi:hypothetical protein
MSTRAALSSFRRAPLLTALTLTAAAAPLASSQPVNRMSDDGGGWIAYVVAIVLVLVVVIGTAVNPKRSHQD